MEAGGEEDIELRVELSSLTKVFVAKALTRVHDPLHADCTAVTSKSVTTVRPFHIYLSKEAPTEKQRKKHVIAVKNQLLFL